jgi:hypothetical protein
MNKLVAVFLLLLFVPNLQAHVISSYLVREGDTLSQVIQRLYPGAGTREKRIYGPGGILMQLMTINPGIKDPNHLQPGMTLKFWAMEEVAESPQDLVSQTMRSFAAEIHEAPSSASIMAEKPLPEKEKIPEEAEATKESLSVLAFGGIRHLVVRQNGAQGAGKVGGMMLDSGVGSELRLGETIYAMNLHTFNYRYRSEIGDGDLRMYGLDFRLVKNGFITGLNIEQLPFFRNNGGDLEVVRESFYNFNLGYQHSLELKSRKPSELKLSTWLSLPLAASSDSPNVRINSLRGYGMHGQAVFSRQLLRREDYQLKMFWATHLEYHYIRQHTRWEISNGQTSNIFLGVSTSMGVKIDY